MQEGSLLPALQVTPVPQPPPPGESSPIQPLLSAQPDVFPLFWISSVQFSRPVVSDALQPQGLQHARLPCPSPTPGAYSNSCPSTRWCRPTISSSVVSFSSRLQSFPASGSFQMSQFFAAGGQSFSFSISPSDE